MENYPDLIKTEYFQTLLVYEGNVSQSALYFIFFKSNSSYASFSARVRYTIIHFITSVLFKYLRRKLRICYSLSCESNFLRKERTKETGQITQETALVVNLGCCILKQKGVFFFFSYLFNAL